MKLAGRFLVFNAKGELLEKVDNQVCTLGAESYLKMMMRGVTSDVSVGGNFYFGIAGSAAAAADILSDVTGEPTATNGYARQACTRDATGFPTISKINGVWRALSKNITFAASGGSFSQPLTRLFLCNAASGTTGILYAYSGALASPITITDGQSYQVAYEFYLQ